MGYLAYTKSYNLVYKKDNYSYRFFISRNIIFRKYQFLRFLNNKETKSQPDFIPISISDFQIESTLEPNASKLETPNPICESETPISDPNSTPEIENDQVEPNDIPIDDVDYQNGSE